MANLMDLDARQRMINMMYIIFIAMLALNMSKEVLQAFGDVNDSLTTNLNQTDIRNQSLMAGLAEKAVEQKTKYQPIHEKAKEIEQASNELVSYIDQLKGELLSKAKRHENGQFDYESMDTDTEINLMFISNDRLSDKAKELMSKIDSYRDKVETLAQESGIEKVAEDVKDKFNTDPVITRDGTSQDWIRYNFEGFPLIAGVTKLTNIQSNAKQVQAELLTNLLSDQMTTDLSMDNYETIVIPDKGAFFSSENFKGKVVLGRYDNTMTFDRVEINGREVTDISGGAINLDFPAGNVGDQEISGQVYYTEGGEEKSLPIRGSYTVISRPSEAVISADKMNVVYRGVQNPMTISIPGVSTISASAPGLTSTGGASYVMNPPAQREVTITASGKLPDGTSVSSSKQFRVKDIPRPIGSLSGMTDNIRLQKGNLSGRTVNAELSDFPFDLSLVVNAFKIQVPGKPIVVVQGSRITQQAMAAISSAPRGSTIQIFDIQASISGNSSYTLKRVTPIPIQLLD